MLTRKESDKLLDEMVDIFVDSCHSCPLDINKKFSMFSSVQNLIYNKYTDLKEEPDDAGK